MATTFESRENTDFFNIKSKPKRSIKIISILRSNYEKKGDHEIL